MGQAGFDPTLRHGKVRGAYVAAPYNLHDEDLAALLVEIEFLCRRHRLRLAAITLDKLIP